MRHPAVLFVTLATLAACAPFPEIGAMGPETGPPPQLVPIEELLAQASTSTPDPGAGLAARAARLKARAAALADTPAP